MELRMTVLHLLYAFNRSLEGPSTPSLKTPAHLQANPEAWLSSNVCMLLDSSVAAEATQHMVFSCLGAALAPRNAQQEVSYCLCIHLESGLGQTQLHMNYNFLNPVLLHARQQSASADLTHLRSCIPECRAEQSCRALRGVQQHLPPPETAGFLEHMQW